jgi:hypothetical protein
MARITEPQVRPILAGRAQCWQASIDARDGKNYAADGATVDLALANLCYRLAGEVT